MNDKSSNYSVKQYIENIVNGPLKVFKELTTWEEKDKIEYLKLLEELEKPFNKDMETTTSKGNRLENIVSFIIEKSFFFEIYKNVHTATNEIDEVIVLSQKGKQALDKLNISRDLLEIQEDIFIGECKNYDKPLNVTYIGKFYSLMVATNISFGIIFTQKGLTGKQDEFSDGYGLIKVLRIIEKYKNNKDMYILSFTLENFKELLQNRTIFEIIKDKKIALKTSANYNDLVSNHVHENENEVKKIINGADI